MLRTLFAALLLVALLPVVGCDGGDPTPDAGPFGVAIRVVDGEGRPLADEPVYARIAWGVSAEHPARRGGGAVRFTTVAPSPFMSRAIVMLDVLEAGEGSARVFDLENRPVATLWGGSFAASTQYVRDLTADSLRHGGVYRLRAEVGDESDEALVLYAPTYTNAVPYGTYEVMLGRTAADGRLVVEDRALFPSLYDIELERIDDSGQALGTLAFDSRIEFVVEDGGAVFTTTATVRDSVTTDVTIAAE